MKAFLITGICCNTHIKMIRMRLRIICQDHGCQWCGVVTEILSVNDHLNQTSNTGVVPCGWIIDHATQGIQQGFFCHDISPPHTDVAHRNRHLSEEDSARSEQHEEVPTTTAWSRWMLWMLWNLTPKTSNTIPNEELTWSHPQGWQQHKYFNTSTQVHETWIIDVHETWIINEVQLMKPEDFPATWRQRHFDSM